MHKTISFNYSENEERRRLWPAETMASDKITKIKFQLRSVDSVE